MQLSGKSWKDACHFIHRLADKCKDNPERQTALLEHGLISALEIAALNARVSFCLFKRLSHYAAGHSENRSALVITGINILPVTAPQDGRTTKNFITQLLRMTKHDLLQQETIVRKCIDIIPLLSVRNGCAIRDIIKELAQSAPQHQKIDLITQCLPILPNISAHTLWPAQDIHTILNLLTDTSH